MPTKSPKKSFKNSSKKPLTKPAPNSTKASPKGPFKISIGIPAYNEQDQIVACLDHVTQYRDRIHEIIVVDNDSSDKTFEIASSYPGVKVFKEKRKGPSFARQRAFDESTGDLMAFLDADTHMQEHRLIKVQEIFKDPKLVFASGPYSYHDVGPFAQAFAKSYWRLSAGVARTIGFMGVAGNMVMRSDTLRQIGGLDLSIAFYGDDTNISRRMHEVGKCLFLTSLTLPSSARRFREQGFRKTMHLYMTNFVSGALLNKVIHTDYENFR